MSRTVPFSATSQSYWFLVSFPPLVICWRQPPLPFSSHAAIFFLMTSLRSLCSGRFSSGLCPLVTLLCHLCLLGGHKDMVPWSSSLGVSSSCVSPYVIRYAAAATLLSSLSLAPHASASYLEPVQQCARELGVLCAVARQPSWCHRASSLRGSTSMEVFSYMV